MENSQVKIERGTKRRERRMDKTSFAIKMNNCGANGQCPICGGRTEPKEGPELFLDESWQEVCWDCGRRFVPELVVALEEYWGKVAVEEYARLYGR